MPHALACSLAACSQTGPDRWPWLPWWLISASPPQMHHPCCSMMKWKRTFMSLDMWCTSFVLRSELHFLKVIRLQLFCSVSGLNIGLLVVFVCLFSVWFCNVQRDSCREGFCWSSISDVGKLGLGEGAHSAHVQALQNRKPNSRGASG